MCVPRLVAVVMGVIQMPVVISFFILFVDGRSETVVR